MAEAPETGVAAYPTSSARRLDEGSAVRRFWKSVAVLAGVMAAVAVLAGPAFGAASITSPSDPFTVSNAGDGTTPANFPVTVTGFTPSTDTIDLMVCDPTDPTTDPTWTAAAHCDFGTDVSK